MVVEQEAAASDAEASPGARQDSPYQFWSHDKVPTSSDEEFKRLIFQDGEDQIDPRKPVELQSISSGEDSTTDQWTNMPKAPSEARPPGPPDDDTHITGSVAAIINLFTNGKAGKIYGKGGLWHEHALEASRSGPDGMVHGNLEIVVAYKLIPLPDGEVDWRNFLVPARDADVNRILREETEHLWENSTGISSLCSLGLTFLEPVEMLVEYMDFCKESDDNGREAEMQIRRIFKDVWVPWFHELDRLDKRASFSWPHGTDEGVETYRLADHFWIWKTLKVLDDLGVFDHQLATKFREAEQLIWKGEEHNWMLQLYTTNAHGLLFERFYEQFGKTVKRLNPGDVQRGVLQLFTTENDVSRKRMLAVARSPRETRFFFHARDTALFYGQDCSFFLPGSNFQEFWTNTIKAQIYHNESEDTGWSNAIRYALGIMAGCRHLTLNKRTPEDLVRNSVEVLLCSTSHNGFFPGQLHEATKKSRLFSNGEEWVLYYHAGFEINYILLTHARAIDRCHEKSTTAPSRPLNDASPISSRDKEDGPSPAPPSESIHVPIWATMNPKVEKLENGHLVYQDNPIVGQLNPDRHSDGQQTLTMKKFIPFNSLIDATSIITIEDEWLYPYPHFLSQARSDVTGLINRLLALPYPSKNGQANKLISATTSQPSTDVLGTVIRQGLESYHDTKRTFSISGPKSFDPLTFIVDMQKQKHLGKGEREHLGKSANNAFNLNNVTLLSKLTSPRTAEQAKKRFIWLPHANAETALLCWAATPERERAAVSLFFDRHSTYEKHIWDDTTMVLNIWQTELHLSFYELVDASTPHWIGLPPLADDAFPGGSGQQIRRASMGFRFDGDFFDRYWTCYYIEHVPSKRHQSSWRFPFDSSGTDLEKQWWQRKVLELFLLGDILQEITKSAVKFQFHVRRELGLGGSSLSFSILDSEAYSSSEDNWHKFEQILHTVEEDLMSILNTLQKWTTREQDRGQEQPRWTRNDERKYRSAINKYRGSTEQHIRDLVIQKDMIGKLKDYLATSRQKIRDDRELRRNENIRYFTYVTVIFLPLGFAASFYSMNGTPENELLTSLIKFAAGALAVTVGLLASAKTLFLAVDVLVVPLRRIRSKAGLAIEKFSRSTM
ncbi:hypothetical protein INS49_015169 [Diaporthe citri]|uniref:uncharacterized protein n=1 Tax=Diaporthe citri TaxID=83186 RepID=UPI001C80A659|nr:uncharacterized protein INS49_015169 [Diaporthe citri]KAG6357291.1 hypothetical protein INS49_015169 [Diaporthe citri]